MLTTESSWPYLDVNVILFFDYAVHTFLIGIDHKRRILLKLFSNRTENTFFGLLRDKELTLFLASNCYGKCYSKNVPMGCCLFDAPV